jgi:diguanylate cyclase (GGDEF)-like protein
MSIATTPARAKAARGSAVVQPGAATDVLVFERTDAGFSLIGGRGRGEGWAGIVEVAAAEESLVKRAWKVGVPVRQQGSRPQQAVGPYHARYAIAVPVGDRHVVVLGSNRRFEMSDAEVVRFAAATVDQTHGVPADKLLADELELVQTLRALMAYQPETVRDTLRHIATVAAGALSCEVAVARVERAGVQIVEAVGLDRGAVTQLETNVGTVPPFEATRADARVDQVAPVGWNRLGADLASSISLPLGAPPMFGVLALGHAATKPRGFTSLCQRIGRAVAESAELLLSQAVAREQLANERDLLARVSGTDPLTGLANRRAWDQEAARVAAASADSNGDGLTCGFVVSADLDDLKGANDQYGHAVGDALIRGAASLLQSSVRSTDLVARIGGDEFGVLLLGANARTAARVRLRIRRAEGKWRVTEHGLAPRLSVGVAAIRDGEVDAALQAADAKMYADKRARRRTAAKR